MDVFVILAGIAGTVGGLTGILMYFETKRTAEASVTSSEASKQSAVAAAASVDEAKKAGQLMREERDRGLERSDVVWRWERKADAPGVLTFRNAGSSKAYSVTTVVHVQSKRYDVEPGDVEPDGTFECDAQDTSRAVKAENQRAVQQMSQSGILYVPTGTMKVHARISWSTELGTPHIEALDADLST